ARVVLGPRPRDVGGNRVEEVVERLGRLVEVHEHEAAPRADLHGKQRVLVVADHAEALARRYLAQPAGEVPAPAVVDAADLRQPRAGTAAQLVAAVQADVLERAQAAVVAADDQHREGPDLVLVEVARVAYVI